MSNLNHYIRQLHPRAESYTPHVDRIQSYLTEANTTEATYAEMAICYHYNLLRTDGNKDRALSEAGISEDNFKKLYS